VARAVKYIALLGVFLAAVSAAAGTVAARRYGTSAFEASAIAALLIWVVGSASLAILASARTPAARLNAALLAMLIRMALPLAAVVYFTRSIDALAGAGIVGLIVVHYLAGLVVETLMSVRIVSRAHLPAAMKAPGSAGGREKVSLN
jgi:hypothetical protein